MVSPSCDGTSAASLTCWVWVLIRTTRVSGKTRCTPGGSTFFETMPKKSLTPTCPAGITLRGFVSRNTTRSTTAITANRTPLTPAESPPPIRNTRADMRPPFLRVAWERGRVSVAGFGAPSGVWMQRSARRRALSCRHARVAGRHALRRAPVDAAHRRDADACPRREPQPHAHRRAAARERRGPPGARRAADRQAHRARARGRSLPRLPPHDRRSLPMARARGEDPGATGARGVRLHGWDARSHRGRFEEARLARHRRWRGGAASARPRRARAARCAARRIPRSTVAGESHAQARAHRSADHERHWERLLRRDPPPRPALAAPAHAQAR